MKTTQNDTVFQLANRPKFHENMIYGLANQYYCVSETLKIRDLAAELKKVGEVWAVAVVNDRLEASGIIVTTQFQEKMSRPYAHDVFDKKRVTELMTETKSFQFDKNIITVSEDLVDEVRKTSNQYYLVEDAKGQFCGIFSTKDLLIHQFNAHRDDIELAVSIQQAVVPETTERQSSGLEIFALSNMAKGVGGDFLAVRDLGVGKWLLSVCDVSGKGVAASLVTASLGGMFAQYDADRGLLPFVSQVNQFILDTFKMEKYLTGVFLELDETLKQVLLCDMGHSYVGVIRGRECLKNPTVNPFVGFVPNLEVKPHELTLQTGDLLYCYTDGLVEQQNVQGEEFGVAALERLLVENREIPLAEMAELLHHKVKKFRGEQPRGDDEAVLLVRIL